MTSNAVALVATADLASLSQASREAAVTAYLTTARDQLDLALGAESVATIKAEISTAADATKRLGLSKEIQSDAQEMVRRAEYLLGKAIRKGQEEGEIAKRGDSTASGTPYVRNSYGHEQVIEPRIPDKTPRLSPKQFFQNAQEAVHTYALADGVSDEEFAEVLNEAREEGNLSRANLVHKIKSRKGPQTRAQRAALIDTLAATGRSSSQMVAKVGISEAVIRRIAREYGIEIPADRVTRGTHRIDSIRVARETVMALEGLAATVDLVTNLDELDPREARQWTASLDQSIRALNRLNRTIRKAVQ